MNSKQGFVLSGKGTGEVEDRKQGDERTQISDDLLEAIVQAGLAVCGCTLYEINGIGFGLITVTWRWKCNNSGSACNNGEKTLHCRGINATWTVWYSCIVLVVQKMYCLIQEDRHRCSLYLWQRSLNIYAPFTYPHSILEKGQLECSARS
jgi:hypothetical protein